MNTFVSTTPNVTHKIGFRNHAPVAVPAKGLFGLWLLVDLLRFFVQAGWFSTAGPGK